MITPISVYDFGKALLDANDLDPVYVMLHGASMDRESLKRWLLAYWCFYHAGTACWIVDQKSYWDAMRDAAATAERPRSAERRHFRGQAALDSVAWLKARGMASLWKLFEERKELTAVQVMDEVKTWKKFGPWIAFKVADMLERLSLADVRFSTADVMYESPQEAADLLWDMEGQPAIGKGRTGEWAMNRILSHVALAGLRAPPCGDRPLGPQEAETMLCKWKSHLGGHYHVGEDVDSLRMGLIRFAQCGTAQRLIRAGRTSGLWYRIPEL